MKHFHALKKYFENPVHSKVLILITALYLTVVFNWSFYDVVKNNLSLNVVSDYLFIGSLYLTLVILMLIFISALSIGRLTKHWLVFLIVFSAIISFMHEEYHVVFDEIMVRNIFETDMHEATELLSFKWFVYVFLLGVIPGFLMSQITIKEQAPLKIVAHKSLFVSVLLILLAGNIGVFYGNYASLLRNNRHIKENIIPTGFIYSVYKYAKGSMPIKEKDIVSLGTDASVVQQAANDKKMLFVLVLGETARVANFSLAGYEKETNPLLAREIATDNNLIFYPQFYSCGTSTAISLPCIFSSLERKDFNVDEERYRENLLDVFAHAGFDVVWVDNNSGCKGVCNRVTYHDLRGHESEFSCDKYGCNDIVLVDELKKIMKASTNNTIVVLHQKGSHGPAYYERVPKEFQVFQPTCQSGHLPECTKIEITNSYDNTILYTDYFLSHVIDTLREDTHVNTGMFYVSDHGESLGEHNLYLHGMPYSIAPDEQVHVPALLWFSDGFVKAFAVDINHLKSSSTVAYSHDNIFHSILGITKVVIKDYRSELDMFYDKKST